MKYGGEVACDAHDGCHLRETDMYDAIGRVLLGVYPIRLSPENGFKTEAAKITFVH